MSAEQRVLDVSALPHGTADSRALLWWGNLGMMAIEGTMFALALATYLYLRVQNLDWPPGTVPRPELLLPTINLALILAAFIPSIIADKASKRDDAGTVKACFAVLVLMGIAFLVIRGIAVTTLGYKWSSHAYGSIVWVIIGLHTFHSIAATAETALLLVYSLVRPVTKKQLLDFRCTCVYWYFLIATWIPFYFVIWVGPYLHRKG